MSVTLHTNLGDIKVEIFCEKVPNVAYNFLARCASGYYNNTIFHRSIAGFMVQGGDPSGSGKGGDTIFGEAIDPEIDSELEFNDRGVLAMANTGPITTSQFFITYAAQPHLNNAYSIFARIISGMETLSAIEKSPVDSNDRPVNPIIIKRVTIHANPIADADLLGKET